jgi:hypothetical protein
LVLTWQISHQAQFARFLAAANIATVEAMRKAVRKLRKDDRPNSANATQGAVIISTAHGDA